MKISLFLDVKHETKLKLKNYLQLSLNNGAIKLCVIKQRKHIYLLSLEYYILT